MTVPTDPKHKLSKNFTLGEVLKSQTATRLGINNTPNMEQYLNLKALCENVMEPVRGIHNVPLIVTSGLRVLEVNRKIGSWDGSQHVKGEAIDFEPLTDIKLEELWRAIVLSNIPYDQIILEFPPDGWLHISHVRNGVQRGRITIATKIIDHTASKPSTKTKYTQYTRDEVQNFEYDI